MFERRLKKEKSHENAFQYCSSLRHEQHRFAEHGSGLS
jgi:hypothetical protein